MDFLVSTQSASMAPKFAHLQVSCFRVNISYHPAALSCAPITSLVERFFTEPTKSPFKARFRHLFSKVLITKGVFYAYFLVSKNSFYTYHAREGKKIQDYAKFCQISKHHNEAKFCTKTIA